MDDAANGTLLDELGGAPGGFDVEAFAIVDEVFASGEPGKFAGGGELFEGGEGAFVGEVVLAGFEDAAANGPAFGGDGGGGNEVDGGVGEDLVEGIGEDGAGEFFEGGGAAFGLRVVDVFEGGAGFGEAVDLAVNVAMVVIGGGEDEFAGFDDGAREADGGVGVAFFGGHGGRGKARD